MILGDIKNWEKERDSFSPALQKAIAYIRSTDMNQLQEGRYEIDGENMFAVVQEIETVKKSERKAESHSKYIDVQYLISGDEEVIGVGRASEYNAIVEDQLEASDYVLYQEVRGVFDVVLKPGMFAVFFPSDLHRPGCSRMGDTKIKKAVIKVNSFVIP